MYQVVNYIANDATVSRHSTREAAERAMAKEQRAFARSPYSSGGAYLPYRIVETA